MHGTWASLVLLVCVGLGCDSAPAEGPRFGAIGRGGDAAPPAAAVQQSTLFTAEGGPVVPGEPPSGMSGTAPSDCAGCHAEIAAEWASSAHARSWTDPIFQAEYRLTGQAFCRHCHAPLALEAELDAVPAAPSESPAVRGIDCAVCHVRAGHVLGPHGRGGDEHAARREVRLATTAFCASCHQFDFPVAGPGERVRYHPGRPLQDTVAEWSQSRYADRPCQRCHMPVTGDAGKQHANHAFHTLDDPEMMARAVRVTADARRRGGAVRVTVVIAPGELGHAFPTGDMFRQAVLTVRTGAARRHAVLMRYFAQTITDDGTGHLLGQVDDTRIPPPGTGPPPRLELELDDPRATEVSWSLELFRLAPDDAQDRGLSETACGVRVQSGRSAVHVR